jgi:hypothetical protein
VSSNPTDRVEIITSVQRRRRWTASDNEEVRIVEETFEPRMTVSLVARRHGVAPNRLFIAIPAAAVELFSLIAAGGRGRSVPKKPQRYMYRPGSKPPLAC